MTDQDTPKIKFPCDYQIRIIGKTAPDFQENVCNVVGRHARDYDGNFQLKESSKGEYTSVMVTIRATGEPQLKTIFEDLKATGQVLMVL